MAKIGRGHPPYQRGIELNKYTLSPIEKNGISTKPMKDMLNQLHRVASNPTLGLPDLCSRVEEEVRKIYAG